MQSKRLEHYEKLVLFFIASEGHEYLIRINTWNKIEIIFFYDSE